MGLHNGTSGGKTAGTELPESPRLRLREMTEADLPVLADMLQDPEVMYAWERTFSDSEVRGWLERNQARYRQYGYGYWLACRREDGEVVGQIGLLPEEIEGRMHVGIGWMLRRKFMKMGFASEGGRACLEYAFRRLRVGRVVADIRPGNRTSRRVAERLGMLLCGEYDKTVGDVVMPHLLYYCRSPLVEVENYDPDWPQQFEQLRLLLTPVLQRFGGRLEHVGSTAVPGLAAKPVIDADYILPESGWSSELAAALRVCGFFHRGDGGLPGREMFTESMQLDFRHNFYVCMPDGVHLRNHLLLRDYLCNHPEEAACYGACKRRLAGLFPENVDAYCAGKSELLEQMLIAAGMDPTPAAMIRRLNEMPAV